MSEDTLSIGEYLRQSREAKAISLDEVSQELHIRKKYLEALEEDDWSRFPGEVYGLGFLKSYARYLEVDADALVNYRKQIAAREPTFAVSRSAEPAPDLTLSRMDRKNRPSSLPAERVSRRRSRPPQEERTQPENSVRVVVGATVVLAVLFVVGIVMINRTPGHPLAQKPARPVLAPRSHHHVKGKDHKKSPVKSSPTTSAAVRVSLVANNPTTGQITYRVNRQPVEMSLAFSGQCWVEVFQNGTTTNPYGVTYYPGQTLTVKGSSSVAVHTGTRTFQLSINHQGVSLPDPNIHVLNITVDGS